MGAPLWRGNKRGNVIFSSSLPLNGILPCSSFLSCSTLSQGKMYETRKKEQKRHYIFHNRKPSSTLCSALAEARNPIIQLTWQIWFYSLSRISHRETSFQFSSQTRLCHHQLYRLYLFCKIIKLWALTCSLLQMLQIIWPT